MKMKKFCFLLLLVLLLLLSFEVKESKGEEDTALQDTLKRAGEGQEEEERREERQAEEGDEETQPDEGNEGQEVKQDESRLFSDDSELPAALLPKPEALQRRLGALQASQGTSRGAHQGLRGVTLGRNSQSCGLCSPERNLCRIISGIFTRSPLPYGYSLVTPVPAGVCNLTITEMKPSKNYFALRRSDGTYILNGNWDIEAAGEYEAGGTTFIYTPGNEEHGERLSAPGPLREPVDFMLISQSSNPGIKYEYREPLSGYPSGNPTALGVPGGASQPGLGRRVPGASVVPSPGQRGTFQGSPNIPSRTTGFGIHTPGQGSAFPFSGRSGGSGSSGSGRGRDTFLPLRPVLQPVIGVGTSSGYNTSTSLYPINPHDPLSGTPRRRLPYLGVPQGSALDATSRTTARLPGGIPRGHAITQTGSIPRPWNPTPLEPRGRPPTLPGTPFLPTQSFPRGTGGHIVPVGSGPKEFPGHERGVGHIVPVGSGPKGFPGHEREGVGHIVPVGSVTKGFPGHEREGVVSGEGTGREGKLRPLHTAPRDSRVMVGVGESFFKDTSHQEQHHVKTITTATTSTSTPPLMTHRTRHHHGDPAGTQDRRKASGKSPQFPAFDPDVQLTQPKASAPPSANTTDNFGVQGARSEERRHRHHHQENGARRTGKKRRKDKTRLRVRGRGRFQWSQKGLSQCSKTCGGGNQTAILSCERKRNKKVVPSRRCTHLQRPELPPVPCNLNPCPAEWVPGEWGPCSVTCGMGVQTLSLVCRQVVSSSLTMTVPPEACLAPPPVATLQVCEVGQCSSDKPTWQEGPWTNCSSPCGLGTRAREVSCSHGGLEVSEERCSLEPRPEREEVCDMGSCATNTWFFSAWSEKCSEVCGEGVQSRRIHCLAGDTQGSCPPSERPETTRPCTGERGCSGQWFVGVWSGCTDSCGPREETRPVLCVLLQQGRWRVVGEGECEELQRPEAVRQCDLMPCNPSWYTSEWSQCSVTCGNGIKRREVTCLDQMHFASPDCKNSTKPDSRLPCNLPSCPTTSTRPSLIPWAPPLAPLGSSTSTSTSTTTENVPLLSVSSELSTISSVSLSSSTSFSSYPTERKYDDGEGVTEELRIISETEKEITAAERTEEEEEKIKEDPKDLEVKKDLIKEEEATKEEKEVENELVVEERSGNDLNVIPRTEEQGDESVMEVEEEEEEHVEEEEEQGETNRKRKRKKDRKKNKDRRVTETSSGSGRKGEESIGRAACIDRIKNCHLVFRARLCRLKYYNKLCCRTCTGST